MKFEKQKRDKKTYFSIRYKALSFWAHFSISVFGQKREKRYFSLTLNLSFSIEARQILEVK